MNKLFSVLLFCSLFLGCAVAENGSSVSKIMEEYYRSKFQTLLKSAPAGDRVAQYRLGKAYEYGYGVSKNNVQALSWYEQSALKNYIPAQLALGQFYFRKRSWDKSIYWYEKASALESGEASTYLGIIYEDHLRILKKNSIGQKRRRIRELKLHNRL